MTFDSEDHKTIIVELVKRAQFPGHLLDIAVELRDAVVSGDVVEPEKPANNIKRMA